VAYYDLVFDQTTDAEVVFLEGIAHRHGTPGKQVLEPGCGSGRLVHALTRRGWSVAGFDIEPKALAYAKARLPEAKRMSTELSIGRFDDFRARRGRFDLAHCLYSSLLHATEPGRAERHLQLVCEALRVGGIYALGLHLAEYDRTEPIRERSDCRREGLRVIYTLRHDLPDPVSRLQPMRCRLTVRDAGSDRVRRLESRWNFRTYNERELRRLLRSEPRLRLVATHDFHHDLDRLNQGPSASIDRVLVLKRIR